MRAKLFTVLWVGLIAGCADSGAFEDSGRTVIAEDQFVSLSLEAAFPVSLIVQVDVHSGPNIDVIVVDEINFQQYNDGNDFVHFTSCGGVAAQGFQRSCSLDAGTYYVVLDNTDAGPTTPPFNAINDGADVSWVIEAS